MHELTRISREIGDTDKSGLPVYGQARLSPHWLTEFYGPFLEPRRDRIRNFLEIGIGQGGSALMWKAFFPEATIHVVDNQFRETVDARLKEAGIMTRYGDAYSRDFISAHFSELRFQVILDDGRHDLASWVFVLNHYTGLLDDGGVLMIEDVQTEGQVREIVRHFEGDSRRLSLVDRRFTEGAAINEMILLYQ